jgi:hypothetical protein
MTQSRSIPAPVPGTRLTEEYVHLIGRFAYLWAWPMVNISNRLLAYEKLPEPGLAGGVLPVGPPNHLGMLHDYIEPSERAIACPNQDVVYGQSVLALDRDPYVIQVPDFGERFWVYQAIDQRTDSFADVGQMYGTKPGAYLVVGPDWSGSKPKGINDVFRCSTTLGMVIPRVFKDSTPEDLEAVQPVINQIAGYPLSKFDGKLKTVDWRKAPSFPGDVGKEEVKWVKPELFFDQLPTVLDQVPPLPGEEALYGQFRAILAAADDDTRLKDVLKEVAASANEELIQPLFQFRHYGLPLPGNWTTQINGAQFGTDYYTRAAVAKSNILVNRQNETKYFYQDLDEDGKRLNGKNNYTVTFAKGALPPVKGFWSLTLYNEFHFFHPNELKRYSLGTKNKDLTLGADGSLTLYVQTKPPGQDKLSNWLPAPGGDFSLYIRAYWPEGAITDGIWTPPPVERSWEKPLERRDTRHER